MGTKGLSVNLKINDSYSISDIAPTDKAAYLEHLKEKQIYDQTLAIPFPYTEADADWWIHHNIEAVKIQGGRSVNWAIRRSDDDYLIGGIGFLGLEIGKDHKAELGYWLAKPYWNKGLMTEAVKTAVEYGFKEFGLMRITAHVFHFNVGSARVLEKAGFQCEGYLRSHYIKDGKIFDGKLYALLKNDLIKTQRECSLRGITRPARSEDAKAILEIYSPYIEKTAITFETSPPSLPEIQKRIKENSKLGYFVYELDGQVVGYAYASKHRERAAYQWCCEVSAYISEEFHGKGIASILYSHLFRQLKNLGYVNAYAGITLPNEKSVGFHESMGFKPIGTYNNIGFKLGRWHDVGWWELQLQKAPSPPEKPVLNLDSDSQKLEVQRTFSGAPWESKVGYCRAIRSGNTIAVTGTAPVTDDGNVFAIGKPYEQAKRCLEIIEKAIQPLGANRKNITRTRIFVTDISKWQEFGRAHGEFFASHPPTTTMVEVKSLIDPNMLVEIEADAILTGGNL